MFENDKLCDTRHTGSVLFLQRGVKEQYSVGVLHVLSIIFESTPRDHLLEFAIEISFIPAHQWRHGY